MLPTLRCALLTAEVDERQMTVLLGAACPNTGLAALGAVIGDMLRTISRDRRTVRAWLAAPREATA